MFLFTPTDALCNSPALLLTACQIKNSFPSDGCLHAGGEPWGFSCVIIPVLAVGHISAVF